MTRYPRSVRDAQIKCVRCNAPVTKTVEGHLVCVDCGRRLVDVPESPGDGDGPAGGRTADD